MTVQEVEPRVDTSNAQSSCRRSEALAVLDSAGTVISASAGWNELRHENPGDALATKLGSCFFDDCRRSSALGSERAAAVVARIDSVLRGEVEQFSFGYSCQQGSRPISVRVTPVSGEARMAIITQSELEREKHAELSWLRAGTQFGDIIEGTTDAVFLSDMEGRLLLANSAIAQIFGVAVNDLVGARISDLVLPEVARVVFERNSSVVDSGEIVKFELTAATARGFRTFLVTKGLHKAHDGEIRGIFGIVRDISEVKAMEREIIDTSDKEKQRLGQELHENLCQYLVGISLLGNVLFEDLSRLGLKQAEDAKQITSLVKEAVTEVRTLVKGLTPLPLEQEAGLVSALEDLAEQVRVIGKINCTFQGPRSADSIDPSVSMHLYRIAQEAVHNAIKHSLAKRVQIKLTSRRREIVLAVRDNGIGFAQSGPLSPEMSSGLGLHIMNYRSRAIGARLEIQKLPGRGTAVVCTMPIPERPKRRISKA